MKKHSFLIMLLFLVLGIVFLIWGSNIAHDYPEWKTARKIMWEATKSAGLQYILAFVFLIVAYIFAGDKKLL